MHILCITNMFEYTYIMYYNACIHILIFNKMKNSILQKYDLLLFCKYVFRPLCGIWFLILLK